MSEYKQATGRQINYPFPSPLHSCPVGLLSALGTVASSSAVVVPKPIPAPLPLPPLVSQPGSLHGQLL